MQAIRSNPKLLALALGAIVAGGMAAPAFAQDAGTAAGSRFSVVGDPQGAMFNLFQPKM